MLTPRTICSSLLMLVLCFTTALAQDLTAKTDKPDAATITGSASGERVRFTGQSSVVQIRLEVYDSSGKKVFDNELRGGNVLDWLLEDGQAARLAADTYLCVVTAKSLSGKLTQRIGSVRIEQNSASLQPVDPAQMNAQQTQAIGPVEENAGLTVLKEDRQQTTTVIAHNGEEGQITRGKGALSFRIGDFYSGKDTEQMRLTAEGNLGIGITHPQARLDVDGLIRASGGILFPDGSIQYSAASKTLGAKSSEPNQAAGHNGEVKASVKGNGKAGDVFASVNSCTGPNCYQAGGDGNTASGQNSTEVGGLSNKASGYASSVLGGVSNTASGNASTSVGGGFNLSSGAFGATVGGNLNVAGGDFSFAGGFRAKINGAHAGTFLYADSNNFDFNSAAASEFAVRATGGFRLVTGIDGSGNPTTGVFVLGGSGNVGIGTSSPVGPLDVIGNGINAIVSTTFGGGLGNIPGLVGRSARGTASSPSATMAGDYLSVFRGRGFGATAFMLATGAISIRAAENFTDNAQGTFMAFETTPIGSTGGSSAERMRIDHNGNVGIGTTSPQSALQVSSNYIQFPTISGGAPPALDCNSSSQAGRIVVRTDGTTNLYICTGVTGWVGK